MSTAALGRTSLTRRSSVGKPPVVSRIRDRKSTRLNSSHLVISYAVFCLKKKKRTFSSVPFRANEIKRDSSVIAIDSSLPQCFSNRLTDHLCRRQRRHAPVIRAGHPAGQR